MTNSVIAEHTASGDESIQYPRAGIRAMHASGMQFPEGPPDVGVAGAVCVCFRCLISFVRPDCLLTSLRLRSCTLPAVSAFPTPLALYTRTQNRHPARQIITTPDHHTHPAAHHITSKIPHPQQHHNPHPAHTPPSPSPAWAPVARPGSALVSRVSVTTQHNLALAIDTDACVEWQCTRHP